MNKIFVCVPTMNDKDFLSTIDMALDYSDDPDNISISTTIYWKPEDINSLKNPFFIKIKNQLDSKYKSIKYDIQPWSLYPGVGAGRHGPLKHFDDEKYFMSIDSHTKFTNGWDKKIIDLYENSRKTFGKRRVLTTYLCDPSFDKNIEVANRWPFFDFYHRLTEDYYNNIYPFPNDKLMDEESFSMLRESLVEDEYLPAKKISAHFYFTESNPWVKEYDLNLDRRIEFWGEEFYQSSLSYARGYNLVWNKTQILFHSYGGGKSRKYDESLLEEFSSSEDRYNIYQKYINQSNVICHDTILKKTSDNVIILDLLNNRKKNFGYLPRSINGFLKNSKIDLINKKISPWWEVPEINVIYP